MLFAPLLVSLCLGQSLAKPTFEWKVPEALGRMEIQGETMADGVPVRMRVVRTKANYNYLLQWFADYFESWGFYVAPPDRQLRSPAAPMITALDTASNITYTVIFQPGPKGTFSLVLAEADHSRKQKSPPAGDFVPLPEGASDVFRSQLEGTRTLTFRVSQPRNAVMRFYRVQLEKRGFRQEEGTFQKDGTRIQVNAVAVPGGKETAVNIMEVSDSPSPEASSERSLAP
ncbi:MAG: hypothetical protein ACKVPX_07720 [Myxococcaceae bacterium]